MQSFEKRIKAMHKHTYMNAQMLTANVNQIIINNNSTGKHTLHTGD